MDGLGTSSNLGSSRSRDEVSAQAQNAQLFLPKLRRQSGLFASFSGSIPFLDRLRFAHVLAFFSRSVKPGTLLVINMGLGIDPYQAVPSARSRGRIGCGLRRACRSWASLRLEEGTD